VTNQQDSNKVEVVVALIVTAEMKEHAARRNQLGSTHRTIVSHDLGEVDAPEFGA
jgi:hypothetical protein